MENIFSNKVLKLGDIISEKRKEINWTQEELAGYLGVTKASVSKWERGRSHPDILLLPEIATLFNITIDELLCYESNLTNNQIVILTENLSSLLNEKGIEEAYKQLNFYLRRYKNQAKFLISMAQWLLNSTYAVKEEKNLEKYYKKVFELTGQVKNISSNTIYLEEAELIESVTYMLKKEYSKIIGIGEKLLSPVHNGLDEVYISALLANGNLDEFEYGFQILLYQNAVNTLGIIVAKLTTLPVNEVWFAKLIKLGENIIDLLDLKEMPTNSTLGYYIFAALGYCQLGKVELALFYLEEYTGIIENLDFPIQLKGIELFDKLEEWLDNNVIFQSTNTMKEEDVKRALAEPILNNPGFSRLEKEEKFKNIVKRLREILL
ncbi:helix-turn-helix domain-containing protein [Miniphocaeibacter halophilus]|uniref:Helix-turn-helix transcriptional regulator n=1 Tax=Miniphocaeibacter halophilus TaxID=2931922 RepID=A0AC61MRJ3_9FIRM|nr:helix-turn-helix transcriptional regulator [Miniphocaeibacter halophilus]QQK06888.1 helix-turn-helix transcriptional regulator [Miniphocaeibacter halophilus]